MAQFSNYLGFIDYSIETTQEIQSRYNGGTHYQNLPPTSNYLGWVDYALLPKVSVAPVTGCTYTSSEQHDDEDDDHEDDHGHQQQAQAVLHNSTVHLNAPRRQNLAVRPAAKLTSLSKPQSSKPQPSQPQPSSGQKQLDDDESESLLLANKVLKSAKLSKANFVSHE